MGARTSGSPATTSGGQEGRGPVGTDGSSRSRSTCRWRRPSATSRAPRPLTKASRSTASRSTSPVLVTLGALALGSILAYLAWAAGQTGRRRCTPPSAGWSWPTPRPSAAPMCSVPGAPPSSSSWSSTTRSSTSTSRTRWPGAAEGTSAGGSAERSGSSARLRCGRRSGWRPGRRARYRRWNGSRPSRRRPAQPLLARRPHLDRAGPAPRASLAGRRAGAASASPGPAAFRAVQVRRGRGATGVRNPDPCPRHAHAVAPQSRSGRGRTGRRGARSSRRSGRGAPRRSARGRQRRRGPDSTARGSTRRARPGRASQ